MSTLQVKIVGSLETFKAYFHFPHHPSMCQSTSEQWNGSEQPTHPTLSSLPPPLQLPLLPQGV